MLAAAMAGWRMAAAALTMSKRADAMEEAQRALREQLDESDRSTRELRAELGHERALLVDRHAELDRERSEVRVAHEAVEASTLKQGALRMQIDELTSQLSSEQREAAQAAAEAERREAERAVREAQAEAANARAEMAAALAAAREEAEARAIEHAREAALMRDEAVATLQPKLDTMTRMLREQQAELKDGYRFAAACKVATALESRVSITLASGFGSWRRAAAVAGAEVERQAAVASAHAAADERASKASAAVNAAQAERSSELADLREQVQRHTTAADETERRLAAEVARSAQSERATHAAEAARGDAEAAAQAAVAAARAEAEADRAAARAELESALVAARTEAQAAAAAARDEHARAVALVRAEAGAPTADNARSVSVSVLQPKLDTMKRMLRDQQAELGDGYRFAAACKISASLAACISLKLAAGFASWRRASASMLAQDDRISGTSAAQSATAEPRRASPRPPLPASSSSGRISGAPRAMPSRLSPVRSSSPTLQSQLDEAKSRTTRSRSSSPKPSAHGQLQHALSKRASREHK